VEADALRVERERAAKTGQATLSELAKLRADLMGLRSEREAQAREAEAPRREISGLRSKGEG
jgi:hypothetical protein